jgi:hypothetical protein
MYEGQTITDNGLTWKVKNVSNKPHSLPYIGGGGVINSRDEIYTSGIYTAPCDGWYQIILKGAGGGGTGGAFFASSNTYRVYGGGCEGGTTIAYEYMNEGDTATITIGAGGTGSVGTTTGSNPWGGAGGNTTVVVNNTTYTAGGGSGGNGYGGSGTIPGLSPELRATTLATTGTMFGGSGCGPGGYTGYYYNSSTSQILAPVHTIPSGTGGGSGYADANKHVGDGLPGGNGYVWFLYFNPNK